MPVATKIAPWASQESSAQLHNFFFSTFFFPTLRLSVWGEWGRMEKEHQNPERKVLSTQPQSHTKRWRDSLCDWYRINQRASHLHTPQSFYSSSSSMLYLMSREEKFTAQHEPEAAGGAHPKWAVDALSLSSCTESSGEGHSLPCAAPSPAPGSSHHPWPPWEQLKTKPGACLQDRRWQLHSCTIVDFNSFYLIYSVILSRGCFCHETATTS